MSVWTTKHQGRDRDYIILKHNLKGINATIHGVKFRAGFAVVEKDSKTYNTLKKFPNLKNAVEYPLHFLIKLPFITRSRDIQLVYGADVYYKFLEVYKDYQENEKERTTKLEKERREQLFKQKIEEDKENKRKHKKTIEAQQKEQEVLKCTRVNDRGLPCKFDALEQSPSGYCTIHLLEDPRLEEFGIELPPMMTREQKKKMRQKLKTKLMKIKKEGKF